MNVDMKRAHINDDSYDTKKCCMIRLHGFGRVSGEQTPAEHSRCDLCSTCALQKSWKPEIHFRSTLLSHKNQPWPLSFYISLFETTLISFTT